MKKLLILENGGITPASNAVAHGVLHNAEAKGWDTVAARYGFNGLLDRGEIVSISSGKVNCTYGGSYIGTSKVALDKVKDGIAQAKKNTAGIDAIVTIGGRDCMIESKKLFDMGFPIVAIPKSVNNDVSGTYYSAGFPSHADNVKKGISGLKQLVKDNYQRGMVVEVHHDLTGWTTAATALGHADTVLLRGPHDKQKLYQKVQDSIEKPGYFLICMNRHARVGTHYADKLSVDLERVFDRKIILQSTGLHYKTRGPTVLDMFNAREFGKQAVKMVDEGLFGYIATANKSGDSFTFDHCSLDTAIDRNKMPKRFWDKNRFYDKHNMQVTEKFREYMKPLITMV